MNIETLKRELLKRPSYFKESVATISARFHVKSVLVRQALEELNEEKRDYNRKKEVVLDNKKLADAVDYYKGSNGGRLQLPEAALDYHKLTTSVLSQLSKEFNINEQTLNSLLLKNVKEETSKLPTPFLGGDPKNVFIVGDLHLPFSKIGYLEFCRAQQEKYNCGSVIFIGDILDNHSVSYHEHDPEGKSIGDEYRLALAQAKQWYKVFPRAKVCIGNHDALPFRKAFTNGLPSTWLKSYQEILESPKDWEWDFTHQIEGVIYIHGTGLSGDQAAVNAARENRQSTVIGHLHTISNIKFMASYKDLIFGMTVGCGIDFESYAFAYGKQQTRKPVISCGIVLQGTQPILIPMNLD